MCARRSNQELSTKLEQANEELTRLASTDALSGLPNKRSLETAIARDLARAERDKTWLSLLVVDVDHFKKVNDSYGHAAGDVVLQAVAKTLSRRDGQLRRRLDLRSWLRRHPRRAVRPR